MVFRRPSHTTVIAYLALFVALSGTALAAKKIGPSQLQKNAVTTKKIANAAVTTPKLANDAVTTAKLDNGAVNEGKLKDNAVTGDKLAAQSVGTNKLKDDAVESGKLANGAVVEAKIGNDAVNGSKVADGSLTLADYARAVIDVSPTPAGPFNNGTCQPVTVAANGVTTNDLPLVLQTVPTPNNGISAVAAHSATDNQITVLFCNYSGGNIAAPPAVPLKIALLR